MEEFNNYMINNQVKLPDEKNDDSFLNFLLIFINISKAIINNFSYIF